MKSLSLFFFLISSAVFAQPPSLPVKPAQIIPNFSQEQTRQIEQIVDNYIVNNPQVLIKAGKKLQEQEIIRGKNQLATIEKMIPKYKSQIFDPNAPSRVVLGNPQGKIIVAEFTQYQCSHCRTAKTALNNLLKTNPEIQLIIIYWPFYGNDAIYTAKAALAAQKQNKFSELNQAFLAYDAKITKNVTDTIIKSISNIDSKKLYADMGNAEFDRGLKNNFQLAQTLNLFGTPTFIFTNRAMTKFSLIPGQVTTFEDDFAKAIKDVT